MVVYTGSICKECMMFVRVKYANVHEKYAKTRVIYVSCKSNIIYDRTSNNRYLTIIFQLFRYL